jgi:hypothetical protein
VALVEVAAGGDDVDGGGVVVQLLPVRERVELGVDAGRELRIQGVDVGASVDRDVIGHDRGGKPAARLCGDGMEIRWRPYGDIRRWCRN